MSLVSALLARWKFDNGIALVSDIGRPSQAHNRFIEDVAETQALMGHMTWTVSEAVYAVRFKATAGAGATPPTTGDVIRVVFDAMPTDDTTDDAQAYSWLQAATESENTDVEYVEFNLILPADIIAADAGWSEWYTFSAPLQRADFLFVDGSGSITNIDIFAEVG